MGENYDQEMERAIITQDLVVKYIEKTLKFKFLAGEYRGKTKNRELIEELNQCVYEAPYPGRGPRIAFRNEEALVMPDLFFSKSHNHNKSLVWVEVKTTPSKYSAKLIIDDEKYNSYKRIYEITGHNFFVVFCLPTDDEFRFFKIYVALLEDLFITKKWNYFKKYWEWDLEKNLKRFYIHPVDRLDYL